MFRKTESLLLITVLVLTALSSGFILKSEAVKAADQLASETMEVKVQIEPIHKLRFITEPVVEFEYPWPGAEKGEALLLEDAVVIEIASNASWDLSINNQIQSDFTVLIRRSGGNNGGWQPLSNRTAHFSGGNGRQKAVFDIKVMAPESGGFKESRRENLKLGFTVSH